MGEQPPQRWRHPRNTAVTPAKAGGQLWLGPQPQPVQNGIARPGGVAGRIGGWLLRVRRALGPGKDSQWLPLANGFPPFPHNNLALKFDYVVLS